MDIMEAKKILEQTKKIPYPEVKNVPANFAYAKMLYEDFAGEMGELSAIAQYVYEHIGVKEKEIKDIMLQVAMEEMRHLDMVGELIKALGGRPIYVDSSGDSWESKYLKYRFLSLEDMMKYNISTEEKAIQGYEKAIKNTNHTSIKAMLDRIVQDEKAHIKIFEALIK